MSWRLTLIVLAVAASVAACHKPASESVDEQASARAGGRAQETTTTSASTESKDRKEQERYRALLGKEIDWADRRVTAMASDLTLLQGKARADKEQDIELGRVWRARLRQDLDALDRRETAPTGTDWTTEKARIERDLDQDRPSSMPRFFEKPYGI